MNPRYLLAASLFLTACGGGGGGSGDSAGSAIQTVPASVAASCQQQAVIGAAANDGLRIARVSWLQVVDQLADDQAMLVAEKATRLRVDVVADSLRNAPARRELRIEDPATGECTLLSMNGPSQVPTRVDETTLANSFVVDIPPTLMKSGTRFSLLFDDASGRSETESALVKRSLAPRITAAVRETLYVVPVSLGGRTGYTPGDSAQLAGLLTRLHPVSAVNIIQTAPFTPSGILSAAATALGNGLNFNGTLSDMQSLLNAVDDYCQTLAQGNRAALSPKCLGVFPDQLLFRPAGSTNSLYTGLAFVGGITMVTQSFNRVDVMSVSSPYLSSHWIDDRALTVAHEYGHLLDLDHAACGGATGTDPRLYGDGRLNAGSGFDAVRGVFFSAAGRTSEFADLMSYCGKEWTSDRGYLASLNYRSGARVASRETGGSANWVKLTPTETGWRLTPVAFPPATLETSDAMVTLHSASGAEDMAPQQAVISDSTEPENRPLYLNFGAREMTQLVMHAHGKRREQRWTPMDWLRTGG